MVTTLPCSILSGAVWVVCCIVALASYQTKNHSGTASPTLLKDSRRCLYNIVFQCLTSLFWTGFMTELHDIPSVDWMIRHRVGTVLALVIAVLYQGSIWAFQWWLLLRVAVSVISETALVWFVRIAVVHVFLSMTIGISSIVWFTLSQSAIPWLVEISVWSVALLFVSFKWHKEFRECPSASDDVWTMGTKIHLVLTLFIQDVLLRCVVWFEIPIDFSYSSPVDSHSATDTDMIVGSLSQLCLVMSVVASYPAWNKPLTHGLFYHGSCSDEDDGNEPMPIDFIE